MWPIKRKHSKTLDAEKSLLMEYESTYQPVKKKKSHKNKSSKKNGEDECSLTLYCSKTIKDHLNPEIEINHKLCKIFGTDETLPLPFESTEQSATKTKKCHKHNSSSKNFYQDEGLTNQHCSNLETATDQLVQETESKRKHSKIFDSEKNLLQYKSTDEPVQKKKRQKNKSSEKNPDDEDFANQHTLNTEAPIDKVYETKKKYTYSNKYDADKGVHLLYGEPAMKKKSHRERSHSKKLLEDIGFPKQHCLETKTYQLETKKNHICSKVVYGNESLCLQYESTDQPVRKKKKSHKNKSSKINEDEAFLNQHCSNSETVSDLLVPETKIKHKHAEESSFLQFEPTDQPVSKKKKSHKKKSSKIHEEEGLSNQHCANSETDPLVPETKIKHQHSKMFNAEQSPLLQFEPTDQPVEKKKKSHKNKSSEKILEDVCLSNQHCSKLKTVSDPLVPETKITHQQSKIFNIEENPLQFESTDQPFKKKKKSHKNKSSKINEEIFSNPHCSRSETVPDLLVPETKIKHKHSKIYNAEETPFLQFEPTDQPVNKKKKSHKKKSSKIHEEEDLSNQHCANSETDPLVPETKIKHQHSKMYNKESPLLQFEPTDQPVEKKKNHKNKSSEKIPEDEGLSNQQCSKLKTVSDPLIPETKITHQQSKIFNIEENPLQFESTDQPAKKKKKSHKNKSSKINEEVFSNQHCSRSETVPDLFVPETKIKHKHSKIYNAEDSPFLQFEPTDQPVCKKKKSSKKIYEEGLSNQHCPNSETDPLVPETKIKHQHSKMFNTEESQLLQCEPTDQSVSKKKKSHKKKSSEKIHEDEVFTNQHCSSSETVIDPLVSETKIKHKHSKILNTEDSPLLEFEPTDQCVTTKKKSHKNESFKEISKDDGFSNQHCSILETAPDHYNANNLTHCNSSGTIPESIDQDDCMNLENKVIDDFDSSKYSLIDFDLTEEPVTFNVPLLHSSESVKRLSEEERKYFQSNGVIIKSGRFSTAEDDILKRNYENFTKHFGVNDPQLLLGLGTKRRNEKVTKFLKAKHFYVRLGKDLNNRSLCNVYRRARSLLDPARRKDKFDDEEVTQLKKLHAFVGSKWEEIGNFMDRSGNTTRSAFLWYDKQVKTGKWSLEERSNLVRAIETVTGTTDLSKVESDTIPWEAVAKLVPTRNFFQCRQYWLDDLCWTSKRNVWNKSHYSKLIFILAKECYVEEYSDIDWKRVQKCFCDATGISPSWVFLRKKLCSLKRYMPPESKTNYKKILKCLSIKYGLDLPL